MSVGISVHVLTAATGLAALIVASPITFLIVKYLGAVYLVYLGVRLLISSDNSTRSSTLPSKTTAAGFFRQGILVDLLNPKIGMFFVAFLPQFAGPGDGGFLLAIGLGCGFIVIGALVNAGIAVAVVKGVTSIGPLAKSWVERWFPAGVLIGLGIRLALTERE